MSKIKIKNKEEIEKMRKAGKILAQIMLDIQNYIKIGQTTRDIDKKAMNLCVRHNVLPAFKGYNGFPAYVCTGLNDVVVHGIPSKDEILKDGDILSVDMGIIFEEYYSDMAFTMGIGSITKEAQRFIDTTRMARDAGVSYAKEGGTIGDIGFAMQEVVELGGFSVVREMVGHGVGRNLHEAPEIPGFGSRGKGPVLVEGMVLAIEAIVNEGEPEIKTSKVDGWTTRTKDGKLSALFEHTVLVKKDGFEVLTVL